MMEQHKQDMRQHLRDKTVGKGEILKNMLNQRLLKTHTITDIAFPTISPYKDMKEPVDTMNKKERT